MPLLKQIPGWHGVEAIRRSAATGAPCWEPIARVTLIWPLVSLHIHQERAMNNRTRDALDGDTRPLFEAAFREHHAALTQYVRHRVGNDADARDIAQQSFVNVLRYRQDQTLGSLRALLFRIATNLIGMRRRAAQSRKWQEHVTLDEELLPLAANDPPPDRRLLAEQELDQLMEAITQLPTKCRQVFILSRFHDMSYAEIAARCDISVKMVEKHITKALAVCRAKVGR